MESLECAIVHALPESGADNESVCKELWQKTAELLLPSLGKAFMRFEPAVRAWGEAIRQPYGVILGKSDPEVFLENYFTARKIQNLAVKYHLDQTLKALDVDESANFATLIGKPLQAKPGMEDALSAHLFWQCGMMNGEIFPDAGLYYAPARQSVIGEKLHRQILADVRHYAIAMVRFYRAADGAEK